MRFDEQRVAEVGADWATAKDCNLALDTIAALKLPKIPVVSGFAGSKIAWKFAVLKNAVLYRLLEFGESSISEWNADRRLASVALARSFLETVVFFQSLVSAMQNGVEMEDAAALDQLAMRETFAARHPDFLVLPEFAATNIVTKVNKIDAQLPGIKNLYDHLSELTHPNGQGVVQAYSQLLMDEYIADFTEFRRSRAEILGMIVAALAGASYLLALIDVFDECQATIVGWQFR